MFELPLDDQPTPPEDRNKIVGTAAYISPEEVRDPDTVCQASDLYSIGVMMFEAACGVRPFEGKPVRELMDAHAYEPAPRPSDMNPSIDPGIEEVILRTLAKTPSERFETAPQMIGALEGAIRNALQLSKQIDEHDAAPTTEWGRLPVDFDLDLDSTQPDAVRFMMMFRSAMLMAFTLLMTSGLKAEGADPHHLARTTDAQLPVI